MQQFILPARTLLLSLDIFLVARAIQLL